MKTTLTTIFLFISILVKSQNTDVLWVPDQNTLVASYNNYSPIGYYLGGYYRTAITDQFIYSTPLSIINRVGLTYINKKNTYSVMVGTYVKTKTYEKYDFIPDVWFKVYPLRALLKTPRGPDFAIGINYSDDIHLGVGLSIGIRGIYRR
jgi:hypothetical protein